MRFFVYTILLFVTLLLNFFVMNAPKTDDYKAKCIIGEAFFEVQSGIKYKWGGTKLYYESGLMDSVYAELRSSGIRAYNDSLMLAHCTNDKSLAGADCSGAMWAYLRFVLGYNFSRTTAHNMWKKFRAMDDEYIRSHFAFLMRNGRITHIYYYHNPDEPYISHAAGGKRQRFIYREKVPDKYLAKEVRL